MFKKEESHQSDRTNQSFFNSHTNLQEPIDLPFDKPILMSLDDLIKMQINSKGVSNYYSDSYFEYNSQPGQRYLITRRKNECTSDIVQSPVVPMELRFDKQIFLSSDEMAKLKINNEGFSSYYSDSHFEYKYQSNGYLLTRRKWIPLEKLSIPLLGENGEIELDNFPQFLKMQEENTVLPPVFAVETFPEDKLLGRGNMGQVHLVFSSYEKFALKLDRLMHGNVKQGRQFTLDPRRVIADECILVSPLSDIDMHKSFNRCYEIFAAISSIPQSRFIAGVKGLAFIKELNQWGLMYEYVNGYPFEQYCREQQAEEHNLEKCLNLIDLSIDLASGLEILDKAGFAHLDLMNPNILLREGPKPCPVLIDFASSHKSKDASFSLESRQQYGKRLVQLAKTLERDEQELMELATGCQSDRLMSDLDWRGIINRLQQIKSSINENTMSIGCHYC